MTAQDGRPRRRSADIRPLLLEAATAEFTAKGYAGVSVRDIAQRGEVAISVFYRHFTGKADVFKAAVISPLLDALEDYRDEWAAQREHPYSDEQIWLLFIDNLYRSFSKHRPALIAYMTAADQLDPAVVAEIREAMRALFREMRAIAEQDTAERSGTMTTSDIDLILHLVVTLVAGATTLGSFTLDFESGPLEPAQLVKGMSALTMWGIGMSRPTRTSARRRPDTAT